jgi:translation initiation factor 2 alpha subunit (eIF-2alpha)
MNKQSFKCEEVREDAVTQTIFSSVSTNIKQELLQFTFDIDIEIFIYDGIRKALKNA